MSNYNAPSCKICWGYTLPKLKYKGWSKDLAKRGQLYGCRVVSANFGLARTCFACHLFKINNKFDLDIMLGVVKVS